MLLRRGNIKLFTLMLSFMFYCGIVWRKIRFLLKKNFWNNFLGSVGSVQNLYRNYELSPVVKQMMLSRRLSHMLSPNRWATRNLRHGVLRGIVFLKTYTPVWRRMKSGSLTVFCQAQGPLKAPGHLLVKFTKCKRGLIHPPVGPTTTTNLFWGAVSCLRLGKGQEKVMWMSGEV